MEIRVGLQQMESITILKDNTLFHLHGATLMISGKFKQPHEIEMVSSKPKPPQENPFI